MLYRYDSTVANHRQLTAGDFVLLRGGQGAFGVAIVESVAVSEGTKVLQHCPKCGTTGIKARKHVAPVWRCNNKYMFSAPTAEILQAKLYVAKFERSYVDLDQSILTLELKSAALHRSDQLSIEEVSLGKLEAVLLKVCPKVQVLIRAGIDPVTLTVRLHPRAMNSDYAHLEGKQLGLASSKRPAATPLEAGWLEFLKRLGEETPTLS